MCRARERKSSLSKGFRFCERYAEGSGVRNGAKLSGWMVDSQEFRKIDWVTFSERIVAQSCDFILDSSEGRVWCVRACEI